MRIRYGAQRVRVNDSTRCGAVSLQANGYLFGALELQPQAYLEGQRIDSPARRSEN